MEVPIILLEKLSAKLNNEIFDIGEVFQYNENENNNDDYDGDDNDNDNDNDNCNDDNDVNNGYLVAIKDLIPFEDVYLIDHMWTIDTLENAYEQLHHNNNLVKRLISMTKCLDYDDVDITDKVIDKLFESIIHLFGSYYYNDDDDNNVKVYYLMDEVGNNLKASKLKSSANFMSTIIQTDNFTYTVIWPIKNVIKGESILCYNLPSGILKHQCLKRVLIDDNITNETIIMMIKGHAVNLKNILLSYKYNAININTMIDNSKDNPYLQCWEHSAIVIRKTIADKLDNNNDSNLVKLILLFYLGIAVNKDVVVSILGSELVNILALANIFIEEEEMNTITSVVQLTPVHVPDSEDLIVMTDFSHRSDCLGFDPVMYIGCDSLGLLNFVHTVDKAYSNCLDLCAGTGIQCLASLKVKRIKKATCVDINRRAIRFLHFNKSMNELDDAIDIIQADIRDEEEMLKLLKGSSFDVVLFNPPYIPSNLDDNDFLVFGGGGNNGEDIIQGAASFLSKLNSNKTDCYIVANFINCDDYNEKLTKWFRSKCVGGGLFHGLRWSPAEYSNLVLPLSPYNKSKLAARKKYEQYLITTGVKDIVNGVLYFSFHSNDDNDDTKIYNMECEIWQLLSGADKTKNIKDKIKSILHK